jgi:hypothetical protein
MMVGVLDSIDRSIDRSIDGGAKVVEDSSELASKTPCNLIFTIIVFHLLVLLLVML